MNLGVRQSKCYQRADGKWAIDQKLEEISNFPVMICPDWLLAIEFDLKNQIQTTLGWTLQTYQNLQILGYQPSIGSHDSPNSDYIWADLGLPCKKELKEFIALMVCPPESHQWLDRSNLGKTLIPRIGQPHWKHHKVHRIIFGPRVRDQPRKTHASITTRLLGEFNAQRQTQAPPIPALSDVETADVKAILNSDFLLLDLYFEGNWQGRNYHSASEGRFGCIRALARYRLPAQVIFTTMEGCNKELHWHDLSLTQKWREVEKAKASITAGDERRQIGIGVMV